MENSKEQWALCQDEGQFANVKSAIIKCIGELDYNEWKN